ncbi:hypothetical protein [Qipengyuania nanhaisediminis]|uniref:hypothetical protein n=1 Tax=Qipengyuania nanhaisediminis TaxID=604088 RepID=UPI0038B36D0B
MTLHFVAAAVPGARACSPIAKAMAARASERAANDNCEGTARVPANDQMLRAALRHFAEHGLGAAREARAQAESAFFAGDRQAYDWWLGITRALDRRLAAEAAMLTPDHAAP